MTVPGPRRFDGSGATQAGRGTRPHDRGPTVGPTTTDRYVVGVGARPGVRAEAVRELLARVADDHGLDLSTAVVATVRERADEPGLRDAIGGADLVVWTPEELAAEPVPHPSPRVAAAVGTPSVAEAAALRTARSRPGATAAELVVPKTVGDGVTLAVAATRRGAGGPSAPTRSR